ncbi:DksA/TraR family C4-type zinc finger protein [Ferrimonas pelagia]|uniref:DksA/TraR family C4-type zinc finger protein n=1 Tax=Ferrimonas pelagia TaxID=1177826 RepID=A0ABP9FK17_9GAMM
MAGGFSKDDALQEQIDATIDDAIEQIRTRNQHAQQPSATECDECGERIPEPRCAALPGVRLCVACQTQLDQRQQLAAHYNRRGSKDSQLR